MVLCDVQWSNAESRGYGACKNYTVHLRDISHGLRTPLTAICGYLDLLEQEEVVDNVAKYLNVIRERTNVMRSLTEELFRYSLMALQEEELHIEQVCINDILEQSLVGFYGVFMKKDIIPDIQMPEIKIMRYLDKMAGNIDAAYSAGYLRIQVIFPEK